MAASRPNIVLVMADDHAAHAMGCYGSRINQTPWIDRLAAEEMPDGLGVPGASAVAHPLNGSCSTWNATRSSCRVSTTTRATPPCAGSSPWS